jgi:pilus assembly protein Flp/PilA
VLIRFLRNESATTAIEYSLVALIVSLAIIVGATAIGRNVSAMIAAVVPYL